jgi:hypothetical protein
MSFNIAMLSSNSRYYTYNDRVDDLSIQSSYILWLYYRGVDHWDIQHALIAKEGKVNTFVTFRGFNKLKQYFNNDYEIRVK